MSTSPSSLSTASSNEAISARSWAGVSQLRAKRMRPQGREPAKKRRSASLSFAPAQPEMKALRSTTRVNARRGSRSRPESAQSRRLLRHDQAIRQALRLQLTAELVGGRLVGDRTDAQPIPYSLGAEIGLLHDGPVIGEQARIFLLHVGEACQRVGLVLLRADLHDIFGRGGRGWRCRSGLLGSRLCGGFWVWRRGGGGGGEAACLSGGG